jgi:ribosomal protein L7/L12
MATKSKTTGNKKNKGLLSEILVNEQDKEIEVLRKENEQLQEKAGYWMNQAAREEENAKQNWEKYREALEHRNSDLLALQKSHQEDLQKHRDALTGKNREIATLKDRFKAYASWVVGIKKLDLSPASADHMLPMDVALARVDTSLSLLYSSLRGETLEQAMQALGYIETVLGFETPKVPKFIVQLTKTDKLYKHEEGDAKCLEPRSTQIHAIKELREHLDLGLRGAKDITDILYEGKTSEIEFSSQEGAEKVASDLRRCGYFTVAVVER